MSAQPLAEIVERARLLAFDIDFARARRWRAETGGRVVAHLPLYAPREIAHAAGMLPLSLFGGGDALEIIRGDAYFQSYICHLPRSTIELLVSGRYDFIDGFLFPATCDVIRNLSGMWQMIAPERYVRYLDLPQNLERDRGGRFYERELRSIAADLARLAGREVTDERLRASIAIYNHNRERVSELYDLRRLRPHLAPTSEVYAVLRAGGSMPVEEHSRLVEDYLQAAGASGRPEMDLARVVVVGTFCEQPPPGLIRTLERAGCYIVDDDLALGLRLLEANVAEQGDPFQALVEGYLVHGAATATRYIGGQEKGRALVEAVRRAHAEGVVFCAPSFCDPALLDQPMLQAALTRAGIPYTGFKYAEDTGQFAVIREQAGTFADSIKLWEGSLATAAVPAATATGRCG